MRLVARTVGSNKVQDRMSIVDERLRYETGAVEPIIDAIRKRRALIGKPVTDQELFEAFEGWTNGYITVRRET